MKTKPYLVRALLSTLLIGGAAGVAYACPVSPEQRAAMIAVMLGMATLLPGYFRSRFGIPVWKTVLGLGLTAGALYGGYQWEKSYRTPSAQVLPSSEQAAGDTQRLTNPLGKTVAPRPAPSAAVTASKADEEVLYCVALLPNQGNPQGGRWALIAKTAQDKQFTPLLQFPTPHTPELFVLKDKAADPVCWLRWSNDGHTETVFAVYFPKTREMRAPYLNLKQDNSAPFGVMGASYQVDDQGGVTVYGLAKTGQQTFSVFVANSLTDGQSTIQWIPLDLSALTKEPGLKAILPQGVILVPEDPQDALSKYELRVTVFLVFATGARGERSEVRNIPVQQLSVAQTRVSTEGWHVIHQDILSMGWTSNQTILYMSAQGELKQLLTTSQPFPTGSQLRLELGLTTGFLLHAVGSESYIARLALNEQKAWTMGPLLASGKLAISGFGALFDSSGVAPVPPVRQSPLSPTPIASLSKKITPEAASDEEEEEL